MQQQVTPQPLVSVIIPVFNDPLGLEQSLSALDNQTSRVPFEVIVVDNDSIPRIAIPFKQFPELTIHGFICNTPGSYAARNHGLKHARGQIIAFLDADCIPARNWLTEGVSVIEKEKYAAMIGGDVVFKKPALPTAVSRYQCALGFQQQNNIQLKGFGATANLWVPRKAEQSIGPFREDLLSGGDREWCARGFTKGFPIKFAPNLIVTTLPRTRLRSAVRQARRVAGGRMQLKNKTSDYFHEEAVKKGYQKESLKKRLARIWTLDYSVSEKIAILLNAAIIWAAGQLEIIRIVLGGKPERR
ncbi:glycosyltransferase [Thiorhodovibrio frisius]|uniref:Glycosyl transferase n=1 Tax=Thiorhodovibrio frisius TaxID=631362 RepID=H8Z0R3_9GAMM|nr:glycosyltransferase family 2 protein [Thiorhodovibrio frisius]EIC21295.1 glycosyl transferase [Thiorhodovibrio frisius]WPL23876.1 Hyaluronan synthase [Thiorhodovibrio frisius]